MRHYKKKCGACGSDLGTIGTISDPYENGSEECKSCNQERVVYIPIREPWESMHEVYVEKEGKHSHNL